MPLGSGASVTAGFSFKSLKLVGTSLILIVVDFTADFGSIKLQGTEGTGLNVFAAMIAVYFVTFY
jgi:hypothetical protein